MIYVNWVKQALAFRLKKYIEDKWLLPVYISGLFMCWKQGICQAVRDLLPTLEKDPIIELCKRAFLKADYTLSRALFGWYLRCSGRRKVKRLMDIDTGQIIYYDYTEEYKRYALDLPCT